MDIRRKPGRPSTDNVPRRKVNLWLAERAAEALRQYGGGSISKGVERAVEALGLREGHIDTTTD